jgi:hypothetical protein
MPPGGVLIRHFLPVMNSPTNLTRFGTKFDLIAIAVSPLLSGIGCRDQRTPPEMDIPTSLTPRDEAKFNAITRIISTNATLTLFEGLPHQGFEASKLERELATKETIDVHGFHFYERPLKVRNGHIAPLRALSSTPGNYTTYVSPKACGGYHPDYCLRWDGNGIVCELLICFGCGEMKLFSWEHELHVDISLRAEDELSAVLEQYRDQRPPME